MPTRCPKCGYARTPADTAPDYECPRCGVVYAKYRPPEARQPRPKPPTPRERLRSAREAVTQQRAARAETEDDSGLICADCGWRGSKGQTQVPGSLLITLILLLFMIIPGVIYEIWRMSAKRRCPSCGGQHTVPAKSPMGRRLVGETKPRGALPD